MGYMELQEISATSTTADISKALLSYKRGFGKGTAEKNRKVIPTKADMAIHVVKLKRITHIAERKGKRMPQTPNINM
jgi:hypothetical protein